MTIPTVPRSFPGVAARLLVAVALLSASSAAAQPPAPPSPALEVRVGSEVDFRPYAFLDADGRPAGFSVDLMTAVARVMGLRLRVSTGSWDDIWNGLLQGNLDVLPVAARLPGREALVDFGLPHTETYDAFFVRQGTLPPADLAGARGRALVVMRSDAAHHALEERGFHRDLVLVDTIPEGLRLVAAGRHDAMLCSKLIGTLEIRQHGIRGILVGAPVPDYKRSFAFAVRKGNEELLERLNQGLLIVKTNGEYNRIYERWLGQEDPWHAWRKYSVPALAGAGTLVLVAALLVLVLQWLVRTRTRQLARAHAEIQAEMGERLKAQAALEDLNQTLERRVAERTSELQETEQRYRSLFNTMTEGFALHQIVSDERGRPCDYIFLEVNPAFERLTGLTRDKLLGKRVRDVLPTIERHWIEAYGEVALTGQPVHLEDFASALNRWFEAFAYQTAPGEFAVVFTDITERRQTEEALRRNEALLRAVLDHSPDPIFLKDWDGRLLLANRATFAVLGKPASVAIGKTDVELYDDPATGRAIMENDRRVMESGRMEVVEESVASPAGTRIYLSAKAPYRDEDGHVIGLIGVTREITARKRAEDGLRESERRFREANERLEEADRRKNEFLAVLSHELRNPLAPITTALYVLDHAPAGGEQASRAKEIIGRQVAQLSNLINDLLDVTRITRNKVQLQKERLELNELVRRTVEDNRALFEAAGVALAWLPAAVPVFVLADRTRVAQIVGNLLQNAAKFTKAGGHTDVTLAVEDADAVVRVSDDGVGMAPETIARLFQPFMQADQTLDRSRGGLGLGLALVKGLVELHGGSIRASSDGIGQGTRFEVRLPRDLETVEPVEEPGPAIAATPRRVLIIEDNVDAAEGLRTVLQLSGHRVEVAYDGVEGVARARAFHPDVVLCDIGLPRMDGYEVARAFRADPLLRATLLVALTGYARPEDLRQSAEAGFDRHLAKPPSVATIQQLLAAMPARSPGASN